MAPSPCHQRFRPVRRADAVTLLSCYAFLLMAMPSSLVVGSFGAAGAPAALLAVAILCWYLVARLHPALGLDRGRQPVRVAVMIFACVVVAAYISANRHAVPVAQQNGADRGLIVLAGWAGVLALAADGIDRADRLRTLLRRIVMVATAMAVLGVIEFFTGADLGKYIVIPGLSVHQQVTDLMSRNGLVRVTATTGQPLEFSAVLAMSLPLALHQARFAPTALRVRRWVQVALMAAAVPMTGSRSAFFGLAMICLVLFPTWHRRDRRRAYAAGLAVPALAWLVKPSLVNSFTVLFGGLGTDQSSLSRADAYSGAAPYIAAHPWLGQGFQTFFPQTYFFVDNQYLTSLIETGILGLLALVACFATGWFTARSVRATAADARTRDLGQCLAASIAAGAVCFGSFDALSFSIAAGLFFLLLGCVGAAWRLGRAQHLAGDQGVLPIRSGGWRMSLKTAVMAAAGVVAVLAGEVPPAAAAPVTRVPCNTPALVSAVSGAASGATLSLAKGCIYVLTAALPTVAQDLTIDGNGATLHRSTAAGTAAFTILAITAGTVTLDRLSFTNGNGAITVDNQAQLTVTGGGFIGNTAANGAAISNTASSVVQVTGASFVGNTATGDGGAIYVFTVLGDRITDCLFLGNTAAGSGGAYWEWSNGTTISGSTFQGNNATTGGALYLDDQGSGITGTVVIGNRATGDGGGIYDSPGGSPVAITDSKIIGNHARGTGGGLDEESSGWVQSVRNTVIAGNSAAYGGGITDGDFVSAQYAGDIIAGNHARGRGGGLYNRGSVDASGTRIFGNLAVRGGGGIYDDAEATVTLTGSSPVGNKPDNCEPLNSITGCTR